VAVYDSKPWPRGEGIAGYADGSARVSQEFQEVQDALAKDPFKEPK